MEFLLALALQILSLNAFVAGRTDTPIDFVVVSFAERRVVMDVEGCGLERFGAGLAYETLLVVSSSKASISGGNGFAFDGFTAAFAIALRSCRAANRLFFGRADWLSRRVTWWYW